MRRFEARAVPGYEILEELGRGGMGVVYKARQSALKRMVALKMVLAGGHASHEELARFHGEAEAVARLQHPNIVQIFDVGEHNGFPFFSLEFCPGSSLARKLVGAPLPPKEAAGLLEQLARAIHYAHGQGIVHRDIKPANVLMTENGVPKITDFGLAKRLDEAGQTQSGAVMGTPSYMAPEQAGGKAKEVGPATDVYGLGAVLYECLTGLPPFRAATTFDTLDQVLHADPVPPRRLQPKVPRDLETVCLKCLQKNPQGRYVSALELADDLHRFLAGEPIQARPPSFLGRLWLWLKRSVSRLFRPRRTLSPTSREAPPPDSSRIVDSLPVPVPPPVTPPKPPSLVEPGKGSIVPPAPPAPPAPGGLFDRPFGKYQLLRKLGQGESGIVYLARHIEQHWQTAIKVLPGARFTMPACVQRLLREARVGAGLRHPNLCQILDAGTEQGEFYLAMEYLEGRTLRHQLEENSSGLAVPLACYHAYQLFDALAYLARHEVVHRDVKPGNVMVCAGDRLKLMDLGLAKVPDPEERRLTMTGIILGTPAYMAPEQVLDASRATARSDLYAAGATLFEMLTGTRPFQGDSPVALMQKVVYELPPDPRSRRPDLPEPLARIILRLLDKEPEKRPDHDEVLAVLRTVCQGLTPLMPEPPVQRSVDTAQATGIQNVSMVARIEQAAERINKQDADDLLALLPAVEGKIRLGNYYLDKRIGPRSAVNTYRAHHYLAGHPNIVRLLPLALSQMAPERLRTLLGQRAQLMQINSPHLSRLLDIGETQLREGTFDRLYYTVEEFLPGSGLEELIASPQLEPEDVEKCLTGATRGLLALHKNGTLHGNLHPGKLFFDRDNGLLRIADLSHARPLEGAQGPSAQQAVQSVINDLDWLGDGLARRRQYVAPEILCDGELPSLLTEQYALGVIFVEVLAHRFLRTHQNDLKLMKCVQQDLQDCLFEIIETIPALGRVLRRMVAINPQARFPSLEMVLEALPQPEQRETRGTARPASRMPRKELAPPPPSISFDVFLSYRRNTGAEIARVIFEQLQQKEVRAFLDVASLDSAGRFDERLLVTIENSPNFIVILSQGSLDRCGEEGDWLRREIAHAIQKERNIVPVLMPRFRMPDPEELPEELMALPKYTGITYRHDYFDEFMTRLLRFLQVKPR